MQYNAAGLLKDSVGAERTFTFEDDEISTSREHFRGISGVARLLRTDRGVLVQAEVRGKTEELCSRCLGEAQIEVEAQLEEEFYPTNHFDGFTAEVIDDEDPELDDPANLIDEDNILDVSEAVRQAFVSAIPMAPLCRVDCKGLCPTCSADRNFVICDCVPELSEPGWAESLRSLKIT